jgi:hypothetical protein
LSQAKCEAASCVPGQVLATVFEAMRYQACDSTFQANQHGKLHILSYLRLWHAVQ